MSLAATLFSLVIANVTLIDGSGRPPVKGVTLVIDGDRFVSVTPADEDDEAPPSTGTRVDGSGKWAMTTPRRFTRSSKPEWSSTDQRSRFPRTE